MWSRLYLVEGLSAAHILTLPRTTSQAYAIRLTFTGFHVIMTLPI